MADCAGSYKGGARSEVPGSTEARSKIPGGDILRSATSTSISDCSRHCRACTALRHHPDFAPPARARSSCQRAGHKGWRFYEMIMVVPDGREAFANSSRVTTVREFFLERNPGD